MLEFKGFTPDETATIHRFAVGFWVLYGGDDYTVYTEGLGTLREDPELNDLIVKLRIDEKCREAFLAELTRQVNRLRGPNATNPLVAGFPLDMVRERLGLVEGTLVLTVSPRCEFTAALTCTEYRKLWERTRVFTLDDNGVHMTPVVLDNLAPILDEV